MEYCTWIFWMIIIIIILAIIQTIYLVTQVNRVGHQAITAASSISPPPAQTVQQFTQPNYQPNLSGNLVEGTSLYY